MGNKNRGQNTGKQQRVPMPKVAIAAATEGEEEPHMLQESCQPGIQSGFRGKNLFCVLGDEMASSMKRPLTLDDCAGNLFSPATSVCRKCGICVCFAASYGKPRSVVGEAAASLHPQRRVFHAPVLQQ